MLEHNSPLAQLLGEQNASAFRQSAFPHSPWHTQLDETQLPSWLKDPLLKQPRKWDATYKEPVEVTRGDRSQYRVAGAPVSAWVEDLGMAMHLRAVDKYLAGASEWLRGLERELGLPAQCCQMSAFLNAPGVGLAAHCDPSEHLLLHVLGRKRIRILPSPQGSFFAASHALSSPPSSRSALQFLEGLPAFCDGLPSEAQDIELSPGSVLFMPRGCYHETVGGEQGISATVVVRFQLPSYAQVFVEYLHDYLLQSAAWRRPVVGAWSSAEDERHGQQRALSALLSTTAAQLATLDSACIFAHTQPPDPADRLDPRDRWVRNPSVLVERVGERGAVRLRSELGLGASEEVVLGESACQLVMALASERAPRSGAQLLAAHTGWAPDALATVVHFLVRKGVLIALRVEPYTQVPSSGPSARDAAQHR